MPIALYHKRSARCSLARICKVHRGKALTILHVCCDVHSRCLERKAPGLRSVSLVGEQASRSLLVTFAIGAGTGDKF